MSKLRIRNSIVARYYKTRCLPTTETTAYRLGKLVSESLPDAEKRSFCALLMNFNPIFTRCFRLPLFFFFFPTANTEEERLQYASVFFFLFLSRLYLCLCAHSEGFIFCFAALLVSGGKRTMGATPRTKCSKMLRCFAQWSREPSFLVSCNQCEKKKTLL